MWDFLLIKIINNLGQKIGVENQYNLYSVRLTARKIKIIIRNGNLSAECGLEEEFY
jgi:hypothetical protein